MVHVKVSLSAQHMARFLVLRPQNNGASALAWPDQAEGVFETLGSSRVLCEGQRNERTSDRLGNEWHHCQSMSSLFERASFVLDLLRLALLGIGDNINSSGMAERQRNVDVESLVRLHLRCSSLLSSMNSHSESCGERVSNGRKRWGYSRLLEQPSEAVNLAVAYACGLVSKSVV